VPGSFLTMVVVASEEASKSFPGMLGQREEGRPASGGRSGFRRGREEVARGASAGSAVRGKCAEAVAGAGERVSLLTDGKRERAAARRDDADLARARSTRERGGSRLSRIRSGRGERERGRER
jgi:hypothetical protein